MNSAQDSIVGNPRIVPHPVSTPPAVPSGSTPYIMPRQTGTGSTRGSQDVSGLFTVTDPKTGNKLAIFGYSPGSF